MFFGHHVLGSFLIRGGASKALDYNDHKSRSRRRHRHRLLKLTQVMNASLDFREYDEEIDDVDGQKESPSPCPSAEKSLPDRWDVVGLGQAMVILLLLLSPFAFVVFMLL